MGRIFFLVNIRTRIWPLGIQSVCCLDENHYRGIHLHSAKPEKSQQAGCFRRWCCLWHRDMILCPFTPLHQHLFCTPAPPNIPNRLVTHTLVNVASLNHIGDLQDCISIRQMTCMWKAFNYWHIHGVCGYVSTSASMRL